MSQDKSKAAASYTRDPKARGSKQPYQQKFSNLIALCDKAKAEGVCNVLVSWPWVLGDTYEEIIESLSRIADAGLTLHIVERDRPNVIHD